MRRNKWFAIFLAFGFVMFSGMVETSIFANEDTTIQLSEESENPLDQDLELEPSEVVEEVNPEQELEKTSVDTETVSEPVENVEKKQPHYTVDFNYNDKEVSIEGGSVVKLSSITDSLGLTGNIDNAKSSATHLFSVYQQNDEWMLQSHQAFGSDQWLWVTMNQKTYEIGVKDLGSILDQDGNEYANLEEAFNAIQENDNVTLYVHGSVYVNSENRVSETVILNKKATVTILGGSYDSLVMGMFSIQDGANVILGENSETNRLIFNNRVDIRQGSLVINKEVQIINNQGFEALLIGTYAINDPISVTINGGVFKNLYDHSGTIDIYGSQTVVEKIENAIIERGKPDGNGCLEISTGAVVKSIKNCTITGGRHAILVVEGAKVGSIEDCTILGDLAGITILRAISDTETQVNTIKNNTITVTAKSTSNNITRGIWVDNATNNIIRVGTIEGNTISIDGNNPRNACITLHSTSSPAHPTIIVGSIQGNTLNADNKSSGIYAQYYVEIGNITNNTFNICANSKDVAGYGIYLYQLVQVDSISDSTFNIYTSVNDACGIRLEGGMVRVNKISNCKIVSGYIGIYITSSQVNLIDQVDITTENSDAIYVGVYGKIGTIQKSTLNSTGGKSNSRGIYISSSNVESIVDNTINARFGMLLSDPDSNPVGVSIGSVSQNTINVTDTAIQVFYHMLVENVIGNVINAKRGIEVRASDAFDYTTPATIKKISDGNMTVDENGIHVHKQGHVNFIEGVVITAKGNGLFIDGINSEVSQLSGSKISAENYAILVEVDGILSNVDSGLYVGGIDALHINGVVQVIDIDPTFYGKSGYAINNSSAQHPTYLEPALNGSKKGKGNAHYLGALGQIADSSKILYPSYSSDKLYRMSQSYTESVTDLDGVVLHVLTIDSEVGYHANRNADDVFELDFSGEYGSTYQVKDNMYTFDGHDFVGWNTQSDGKGTWVDVNEVITLTDQGRITLYAIWSKPVVYVTVTFDSNGGTSVPGQTIETGSKVNRPIDPEKEGYTFNGWYLNDQEFKFDSIVNSDITLVAKWEKVAPIIPIEQPTDDPIENQPSIVTPQKEKEIEKQESVKPVEVIEKEIEPEEVVEKEEKKQERVNPGVHTSAALFTTSYFMMAISMLTMISLKKDK